MPSASYPKALPTSESTVGDLTVVSDVTIDANGIIPVDDNDLPAGSASKRFSDLHTVTGTLGGSTATGTTLKLLSAATDTAQAIWFGDADDADVGKIYYHHTLNIMALHVAAQDQVYCSDGNFYPATDNDVSLGGVANRWSGFHAMAATVYGDVTLNEASPTLTVGAGTGAPVIISDKADLSEGHFTLRNAGATRWILAHESNENLTFHRYNSSAVYQDSPISINQSSGVVSLGLAATSPRVMIGESALGSPILDLNKGAADNSQVRFLVSGSLSAGVKRIEHDSSEGFKIGHYNGSGWDTAVSITDGDTMTLGATSSAVVTTPGKLELTAGGPTLSAGSGTPESSVTADVGSIYMRTDGGASTSVYIKESGTGNTGWVAK